MIEISNFPLSDPVTGTCFNVMSSNRLLIDNWCSISKGVSHISDYGFNYLLGSIVSTEKSESVAKFRFASTKFQKVLKPRDLMADFPEKCNNGILSQTFFSKPGSLSFSVEFKSEIYCEYVVSTTV